MTALVEVSGCPCRVGNKFRNIVQIDILTYLTSANIEDGTEKNLKWY